MTLTTLFLDSGVAPVSGDVYLKHDKVKLVTGHVYRLTYKVRSNIAQTINTKALTSAGAANGLNTSKYIRADAWKTLQFEFTATTTDHNSQLRVQPASQAHTIYFDQFRLIDLTLERKQYRIMRIQGSILPGTFIQTLTLREKTTAETA